MTTSHCFSHIICLYYYYSRCLLALAEPRYDICAFDFPLAYCRAEVPNPQVASCRWVHVCTKFHLCELRVSTPASCTNGALCTHTCLLLLRQRHHLSPTLLSLVRRARQLGTGIVEGIGGALKDKMKAATEATVRSAGFG